MQDALALEQRASQRSVGFSEDRAPWESAGDTPDRERACYQGHASEGCEEVLLDHKDQPVKKMEELAAEASSPPITSGILPR